MKPWEMYQTTPVADTVQPKPWERNWGVVETPKPEKRDVANGTLQSVYNGLTFGLADESAAAGRALNDMILHDKQSIAPVANGGVMDAVLNKNADQERNAVFDAAYDKYLPEERALQKEFDKQHPFLSIGGNVAGAIVNPISRAVPVVKGASLGSKVAMGALQGTGYGAAYGFGEGEGGLAERVKNAGRAATRGAVVGAAVPVAVEGVKAVGRGIADVAGQASGAGGESLKRAYDAGTRNSQTFKDAMRGKAGVYDVVDDVDKAVRTMEQNASAKYRAMLPDNGATLKLPDTEFKNALKKATDSISGVTAGVDDTAAKAINKVHKLAQNIKASGGMTFDNALEAKKAIDGIIEPLARQGEKNTVRLLTPIKQALNGTLESAVPEYGGARAAFRADAHLIDTIKKALTSNDPTTELRKLQGITRQSVAAAQGGKQQLGKILDDVSGGKILDAIAGGQTQQLMPRDPLRFTAAVGTTLGTHALNANPVGIAVLPAFSPRASGEIAYKLGQIGSKLPNTNTNAVLRVYEALSKR